MWKTGAQRLGFSAPDVMHVWRNIRHRAGGGRTGWTGVGSRTFRDVDVAVAVGVDGVLGIASSAHVDRTEPGVACGTRDGSRGVQHVRCDEEGVWRDLEGEYRGDSRLGTKKRAGVGGSSSELDATSLGSEYRGANAKYRRSPRVRTRSSRVAGCRCAESDDGFFPFLEENRDWIPFV